MPMAAIPAGEWNRAAPPLPPPPPAEPKPPSNHVTAPPDGDEKRTSAPVPSKNPRPPSAPASAAADSAFPASMLPQPDRTARQKRRTAPEHKTVHSLKGERGNAFLPSWCLRILPGRPPLSYPLTSADTRAFPKSRAAGGPVGGPVFPGNTAPPFCISFLEASVS